MSQPMAPVELNARNLRFRDNKSTFDTSARWLASHQDEAIPVMLRLLEEEDPAAIGVALVLGKWNEPRAVPGLEAALASSNDQLAFEAARALAGIEGEGSAAALRRGAASTVPGVARNALRGIGLRKDPGLCDAVRPRLADPDPIGTYARQASDALGCG